MALVLFAVHTAATLPVSAQSQHRQVLSANPFGLLLEWFNGEYERVMTEAGSFGVSGSHFRHSDDGRYTNGDLFVRYYPGGTPFAGWAFGARLGITRTEAGDPGSILGPDSSGTHFGYGFDVNHSWLLGRSNNFYVGVGFGLKRLVGVDSDDPDTLRYIPSFRVVNVGFAF